MGPETVYQAIQEIPEKSVGLQRILPDTIDVVLLTTSGSQFPEVTDEKLQMEIDEPRQRRLRVQDLEGAGYHHI